jgi:hypothetical protein
MGIPEIPAEPDIRTVAAQLTGHLGPDLVAALAGSGECSIATRWSMEDGPEPDATEARRLRFAWAEWHLLAGAEGPDTARAWFAKANPWLGDDSPASAIGEDRFREVARAVALKINYDFEG